MGFEEFFEATGDVVGGADEVEEEFLLDALEGPGLVELFLKFTTHADTIVVSTHKRMGGG